MITKCLKRLPQVFCLAAVIAVGPLGACAETYSYEGFEYGSSGFLVTGPPAVGANGGSGWSGAWYSGLSVAVLPFQGSSLIPATLATPTSGGSILQTLSPGQGVGAYRVSSFRDLLPGQSLWVSTVISCNAVPGSFAILELDFTSGYTLRLMAGSPSDGTTMHWNFSAYSGVTGPAVTAGVPALLVAKIQHNLSPERYVITFWVDPAPAACIGSEPTDPPVGTQTVGGPTPYATLDYITLSVSDPHSSTSASTHQFDEIRLASAYSDLNLVPAPALRCPPLLTAQCDADVPAPAADMAAFLAQGGTVTGGTAPVTLSFTGDVPVSTDPKTITRTYTATDACGRSANCSQSILIQDQTMPKINCPADILIVSGPGTVTYGATVIDSADLEPVITFDPPSGSTFPMGRTQVTCQATDRCGNTSSSTFNVTVTALGCTSTGPCARDDSFSVPTGLQVLIPTSALLGNDAHSVGLPIAFSGNDPATAGGVEITSVGLPVNGLRVGPYAAGTPGDHFSCRIADGSQEATATVHLVPISVATPAPNALTATYSLGNSGLTFVFNAPSAATHVLERFLLSDAGIGAVWTKVASQTTTGAGPIAFADGFLPGDAMYRVRQQP